MKKYKKDGTLTKAEEERQRVAALPRPSAQELAKPQQARHAREETTIAYRQGECGCCGCRIDPGDSIHWVPDVRSVARHAVCPVTQGYRQHLDQATQRHRAYLRSRLSWILAEVRRDRVLSAELTVASPAYDGHRFQVPLALATDALQ